MSENNELCFASLEKIGSIIKRCEVSPFELTKAMLERIETIDRELHSYNLVCVDQALERARAMEREIFSGIYRGPLHGVPVAVKDLFATKNIRTTCSSKVLANWIPGYNAKVVDLLEDAGAVVLGKLNMTEFALYGYHPDLQVPVNPWSHSHWSGVSSSGSAVATAAHLAFATLGTDTGGSIRFPAAANGVVGLKPTYGRVSRQGAFPLALSLDHIGPITKTVADAALMLNVIAGYDANDPTTFEHPKIDFYHDLEPGARGKKIGIDEKYIVDNSDPRVASSILDAAEHFKSLGAELVDINICEITEVSSHWGLITAFEAAANHEQYFPDKADLYGPAFRDLLEAGTSLSETDVANSYTIGNKVESLLQSEMANVDMLLCPSMPVLPPTLKEAPPYEIMAPEDSAPLLCFTAPFNFSGNPTISLPSGYSEDGLPISLQLVGHLQKEKSIIQAAHAFEQSTHWHKEIAPAARF
jgi:amidase